MAHKRKNFPNQEASSLSVAEILEDFQVNPEQGLTESAVQQRRSQYGLNRLEETKRRSTWQILIAQFKSPIIALREQCEKVS